MDDNTSVRVAVRVRPLVPNEKSEGCSDVLDVIEENEQIVIKTLDKAYTFNYVLPTCSTQDALYKRCVQPLLGNLFKGYNLTILAYGQTGSGKSHTMGTAYTGVGEMGVIPRAITELFDYIKDNFLFDLVITVSFVELCQEILYDLLSDKPRCNLEIRENASKGIHIPNLTEVEVDSVKEIFEALQKGTSRRATSSTAMNAHSSISHAILTVNIAMNGNENCHENKQAKLHLVDLAGSKQPKKTGLVGKKESVTLINKGLFVLHHVISALGDEIGQHKFIPYRDSNLTRLLKDSLGGNSITLMIACVSPADYNLEETISTLRYADRARKIKNKPIVNKNPPVAEINELKKSIRKLRLNSEGQGSTGLFGQQQQTASSGLFNTSSTFGQQNKSAGCGFGAQPTQPSLFGQQVPQKQTFNIFQPSTINLFGSTAFGAQANGTGSAKFNPVTGNEYMMKNEVATSIKTKHHSITCMQQYENKSFEELRYEDYLTNRKGPQQQATFGITTRFGGVASSAPSTFGLTTSTFGQGTSFVVANQKQPTGGHFGKPTTGSTGLFGQQQQPATSGLFNTSPKFGQQNKSARCGFGAQPTQPSLFGQQVPQQQTYNIFQPSTINLFGSTAFANGTGSVKFNQVTGNDTMMKNRVATSINTTNRKGPQQQATFGSTTRFGGVASSAPSPFGLTPSTFGQGTSFGVANQQEPTGGLFGKPTTAALWQESHTNRQLDLKSQPENEKELRKRIQELEQQLIDLKRESSLDDDDDIKTDPACRKTPLGKRILEEKRKALNYKVNQPVKSPSDFGCKCKIFKCAVRCGCIKLGRNCGATCKCDDVACENRDKAGSSSSSIK